MNDPTDTTAARHAQFVLVTPGGAYHAVSRHDDTPLRRLLLSVLRAGTSPNRDADELRASAGADEAAAVPMLLQQALSLGFLQLAPEPRSAPPLGLGHELNLLMPRLSSTGQALLVDWNGLTLASAGLEPGVAGCLAALSADLIAVQERHAARLAEHLGLATHGWAAVNAYGSSRIGAWPLYVGEARLMLVLLGEPTLNSMEFLNLVWLLTRRYA